MWSLYNNSVLHKPTYDLTAGPLLKKRLVTEGLITHRKQPSLRPVVDRREHYDLTRQEAQNSPSVAEPIGRAVAGQSPDHVNGAHAQRQKQVFGLSEAQSLSCIEVDPTMHQDSGEFLDKGEDKQTGEVDHAEIRR